MTRQTKQFMLAKNSARCSSNHPIHRLAMPMPAVLIIACLIGGYVFPALNASQAAGSPEAREPQAAATAATAGTVIKTDTVEYRELFDLLVDDHGFDRAALHELFAGIPIDQEALDLISNQAESRPLVKYLALLATPAIIQKGKDKLAEHRALLDKIETDYGVDREYLIAIWGVETRFGERRGKHKVFRVLNTLFANYPRRSRFFRDELIQFLLLCRESGIEPRSVMGSYAGAFGQPQFIPSSFREYAVSYDGTDTPDVFDSIPDILASIANYLHRHQWVLDAPVIADIGGELRSEDLATALSRGRRGKIARQEVIDAQGIDIPPSPDNRPLVIVEFQPNPFFGNKPNYYAGYPNFQAITAWNHSNKYAMIVTYLAQAMAR